MTLNPDHLRPNQTGTSDRRPRLTPSQVLAHMARPRIKTPAEAFAAGLGIDHAAREAGFADGAAGRTWSPGDLELLSYAVGYVAGTQYGRTRKEP